MRKVLKEAEIVSALRGASLTPLSSHRQRIAIGTALFNNTISTKEEGNTRNWKPIDPLFNHVVSSPLKNFEVVKMFCLWLLVIFNEFYKDGAWATTSSIQKGAGEMFSSCSLAGGSLPFQNTGFSSLHKKDIRTVLIMVCNTAKSSWPCCPQQFQWLFAPPGAAIRSPSLQISVNRCFFFFLCIYFNIIFTTKP